MDEHFPRNKAYILFNQVAHTRLLPSKSKHSFSYPTASLLLSASALESHSLDLGYGWIFSYGGTRGRLLGLRSKPYLYSDTHEERTIQDKLRNTLIKRGYMDATDVLEDFWIMTMPNYLGFEGINPLTVYYCYASNNLWITVLEVHNTFGESHVYILQVGKNEDDNPPKGYDHQWTFSREFHVSPFNDRCGFYTVAIRLLPGPGDPSNHPIQSFKPLVKIRFHTSLSPNNPDALGPMKFVALLRASSILPMTSLNLLRALYQAPFSLLLTLPRILYEAYRLHYLRRLNVYIRPEPLPSDASWGAGLDPTLEIQRTGGGIKWNPENSFERYARYRIQSFLRLRATISGITITLVSADSSIPARSFGPENPPNKVKNQHLKISYLCPRFFTIMFQCPSAHHALLLGSKTERLFFVSSEALFLRTFSCLHDYASSRPVSTLQRLRSIPIPKTVDLPIPTSHPLDEDNELFQWMISLILISSLLMFENMERFLYGILQARFVPGNEPWKRWERAAELFTMGTNGRIYQVDNTLGSFRREQ